jgi:DNA polymerase/3'-5' exonuclease PolX
MSNPSVTNEQIAEALRQEADTREGYSASALLNAARIIATFPVSVMDANQLKGIRGIGDGTRKRVATILSEGLSNYIPPSPPKPDPTSVVAAAAEIPEGYDFTSIKFFGNVANRNLHSHGIHTFEELQDAVETALNRYDEKGLDTEKGVILEQGVTVTANQLAGLRYFAHLAERVPRAEVKEIGEFVLREAEKLGMTGQIVGSYRRGRADSGDVDNLLTGPKNRLHELVQHLWDLGIIRFIFSLGEVKLMAAAVRPSGLQSDLAAPLEVVRRSLDIRYVSSDTYGSALLFSTGPDTFNVQQRQIAIEQNLKLSEYGLTDTNGTRLPAYTEQDVFEVLGMDYLTPEEREQYATEKGVPRKQ